MGRPAIQSLCDAVEQRADRQVAIGLVTWAGMAQDFVLDKMRGLRIGFFGLACLEKDRTRRYLISAIWARCRIWPTEAAKNHARDPMALCCYGMYAVMEMSTGEGSAPASASASASAGPVDMHVHVVGNGSGNTGCWLRISPIRRPMASLMLRQVGLPASALKGDLDRLYVERLLELVRESSLAAVVILAQEQVHDDQGRAMPELGSFYVPNEYVLSLARRYTEFLPAVSIHPARPDALDELERCLAGGAVMMKCLPNCQNINCSDRRFTRFWERMAEAGLPLLAHTGGEHTLPIVEPKFSDPRTLALPLECGVTVIAAHCGTKSGLTDPEYFHIFSAMTERFSNLYGDNSAFTVPIRGRHVPACTREPLASRILHGSDFPVPVYGHFPWLRGFVDWKTFRTCERQANVLEKDFQLKRAMGFAPETFTRIWALLRTRGV